MLYIYKLMRKIRDISVGSIIMHTNYMYIRYLYKLTLLSPLEPNAAKSVQCNNSISSHAYEVICNVSKGNSLASCNILIYYVLLQKFLEIITSRTLSIHREVRIRNHVIPSGIQYL